MWRSCFIGDTGDHTAGVSWTPMKRRRQSLRLSGLRYTPLRWTTGNTCRRWLGVASHSPWDMASLRSRQRPWEHGGLKTGVATFSQQSFCWGVAVWSWDQCTRQDLSAAWGLTRPYGSSPTGSGAVWRKSSRLPALSLARRLEGPLLRCLGALDARPCISQRHGTVEHQRFRAGIDFICAEITQPLELVGDEWFGVGYAGLHSASVQSLQ